MADDIAKRDFSVILENLNRKFDITYCKWTEDKLFVIKFRTHIPVEHNDYNTYCDNWADAFSQVTETIWVHIISNTGPKVKFRKQYQCWTYEDKEVQKDLLFDACRCRATIDIKILGDASQGTKKMNKYLRLGLNALVKINFHHLHPVDIRQNYSFFVHRCVPQAEPPRPLAQPNERVSQLVAKMLENAAITSQKAAERAEEALKRQCIVPQNVIRVVQQAHTETAQVSPNIIYQQDTPDRISQEYESSVTQVVVSADDEQATETYYLQQVVFDSTTQTITEVIPVSAGIPHLVQVQMPQTTQALEVQNGGQGQSVMQQY